MNCKSRLSLVIPCYNENLNIKLFLERIKEIEALFSTDKNFSFELIVVDGFSNDGSQENLKKYFENLDPKNYKLCLMDKRQGYGKDIAHGLSFATGDVLAWTHADMQTDPLDVFTAFEKFKNTELENINVLVKGKRLNRPFLDRVFTIGMQVISLLFLRVWLDDINAQPKLFSKGFFEKYIKGNTPSDFSIDLFILYEAKRQNLKILTIPVIFADRIHGEAKGGGGSWKMRINLIKRTFKYIFKLSKDLSK